MTTEFSFSVIILALILLSLFKRVCLWVVKFGQWRKKWTVDSISFPQIHKGSIESWKLCLNLCSFKWLKPILRRVRSFSSNGLFILKALLEFGLMTKEPKSLNQRVWFWLWVEFYNLKWFWASNHASDLDTNMKVEKDFR